MMSVKGLAPLYRNSHDLPWIPFTPYSTSVKLKLLKIDPVTGQVITLLHVPGGEGLGVHNHHVGPIRSSAPVSIRRVALLGAIR